MWLLEDSSSTIAPTHKDNHFEFSPFDLEQGISVFAETSTINNEGLPGNSFTTLLESSYDPNMFLEQDSTTLHNGYPSPVESVIGNELGEQKNTTDVSDCLRTGKGLVGKEFGFKTRERKSKIKDLETEKRAVQTELEEESFAKKQDHNEKERVRRMKLHGSYVALGSLLPISKASKVHPLSSFLINGLPHLIYVKLTPNLGSTSGCSSFFFFFLFF